MHFWWAICNHEESPYVGSCGDTLPVLLDGSTGSKKLLTRAKTKRVKSDTRLGRLPGFLLGIVDYWKKCREDNSFPADP